MGSKGIGRKDGRLGLQDLLLTFGIVGSLHGRVDTYRELAICHLNVLG